MLEVTNRRGWSCSSFPLTLLSLSTKYRGADDCCGTHHKEICMITKPFCPIHVPIDTKIGR